MQPRRPHLLLALALVLFAASLSLSACGEKSENLHGQAQPLTLTLDFYPNVDHAGIYLAEKRGYFADAGLDVTIRTPSDPAAPIRDVAAGQTDLAISYEPEVLLAREQGFDVRATAALVDSPLTSLIWLADSGIGGIGDLRGKTVATAGIPYQAAYLKTILARASVPEAQVQTVGVGLGLLPAIIGHKAAAILGGFRNVEGVDLRLRGQHPVVMPVDQLGVPTYDELVLVAQGKRLDSDPDAIRLFIAALARGTADAVADPDAALSALLEANPSLDPATTRAELGATLPLLAQGKGRPFEMDPRKWKTFIAWMRDNGLIASLPAPGQVLTNAYLPGNIPE